jgi:predicted transcriptional regulator
MGHDTPNERDAELRSPALGGLEFEVMEILWAHGWCSVRDVVPRLGRHRAHSTVVSALDRLHRKGFVDKRTGETALVYAPRFSREDWARRMVGDLVAVTQASPLPRSEVASFLVESIAGNDESLLDQLLKKIEEKRRQLEQGKQRDT